jgi:prophage tail gpP-like protein
MTRDFASDTLGAEDDVVSVYLADQDIRIFGSYEVKTSVFTQPAAFNLRIGWGAAARDLLRLIRVGDPFELRINDTAIQAGQIEAVDVPNAKVTELSVRGRDWMAPLFRTGIYDERQYASKTLGNLVGEVVAIVYYHQDRQVLYDNAANRSILTKTFVKAPKKHPRGQLIEQIDTGAVATGGAKIIYQNVKCKVGETYFQFLDHHLRLAGVYMWATPDGDFILGAPNTFQPPTYLLTRRRGQTRNECNVEEHGYRFDITHMHSAVLACGRYQGRALYGIAENPWCTGALQDPADPFKATLDEIIGQPTAIFDDEIKTPKQAEWLAKRRVSEEMRAGFHLTYTISGHKLPCPASDGRQMAIVTHDTMAKLEDDELGFNSANDLGFGNDFWLDEISYKRSNESGTTTSFDCIHPLSVMYLAETDPDELERLTRVARTMANRKSYADRVRSAAAEKPWSPSQ